MTVPAPASHHRAAAPVLVAGGVLLGSGLLAAPATGAPARVLLGVAATSALSVLAVAAGRVRALAPARDGLLVLAALSVFGWASALVLGLPSLAHLLDDASVAVVFLVVNATKLTSVVPLFLLARWRGWSWRAWLVRRGRPGARSSVGVRWPWLALATVLVVETLFLGLTPGLRLDRASALLPWLPVMLLAARVNASCEELLYRHALVGATRGLLGVVGAVLCSSAVFGLAHLTGTPGGRSGVLFTAAYGAVCGAAMVQTRGAVWNLAIHVSGDLSAVTTLFLLS